MLVSISQSRCLSFQVRAPTASAMPSNLVVSISQSRCLSFQVYPTGSITEPAPCFNLAIEMLVISGLPMLRQHLRPEGFNLAIEMLVISGRWENWVVTEIDVSISQSRCLSFQGLTEFCVVCAHQVSISQSRCLSFQA